MWRSLRRSESHLIKMVLTFITKLYQEFIKAELSS